MTFEEFFKKKRVDLVALEKGEPALFSEFKMHFEQMGEKSFDHTKKYWFNKTRRQFPLAPEVKTEKVQIENQLAEQTVIESLVEPSPGSPPPAKLGFVPKFKAGNMPKPAIAAEENKEDTTTTPPAKLGFTPKFKAGNMQKPVVADDEKKEDAVTSPPAKLGFVPKFKAGITPKPDAGSEEKKNDQETPSSEGNEEKKPAYKPRFNMKNIPPKSSE